MSTPLLKVTVATHHFVVYPQTDDARKFVYQFLRGYIHENTQGKAVKITTYAAGNKDRTEFRFHINTYAEFRRMAYDRNLLDRTEITVRPVYEPRKVALEVQDGWTPRDSQPFIIKYLNEPVAEKDPKTHIYPAGTGPRQRFVGLETGGGKAFGMDVKVKTPDGWKRNGDLQIGDVVMAWDGSPTTVVGIHPQGVKPCMEVTLNDSRSCVVCEDHLWGVYVDQATVRKVFSTKQIKDLLAEGRGLRIDLHYAYDPGLREEFDKLLHSGPRVEHETGLYQLSTKDKAEADKWEDMAWACGYACRKVDIGEKVLLFIVRDQQTFETQTIPLVRVMKTPEQEVQCIEIAHPDKQFIIEKWIVTHNTATALFALAARGELFAVVVQARFTEKWVGDIAEVLKINSKKEILLVEKGEGVQGLTQMAVLPHTLKNIKAIVISNRSYDNYLRLYEDFGFKAIEEMGYMVPPDQLFERLGVGTRLIDEVHQEFHAQYRLDLYTHVPRSISLTATLKSNDKGLERFYDIAYPKAEHCPVPPLSRFRKAHAVSYSFPLHWNYKTSNRGMSSYSHIAYEESILKSKEMKVAYFGMVKRYLDEGYIQNYRPGNKFGVYCATIDMCTEMTNYLAAAYPHLTIKRYVAEDKKFQEQNLKQADGRVTTPGAAGTGHDIKGLTDVHNTINMDAFQPNVQILGRLRYIEGQDSRFYWYNNIEIPQHIKYDKRRINIFQERVKGVVRLNAGTLGPQRQRY